MVNLPFTSSVFYGEALQSLISVVEKKAKKRTEQIYSKKLDAILAHSVFLGSVKAREENPQSYDLEQLASFPREMQLINSRIQNSASRLKKEDISAVLESLAGKTEEYLNSYVQQYAQENKLAPLIAQTQLVKEAKPPRIFYLLLKSSLKNNSFAGLGQLLKNCDAKENLLVFKDTLLTLTYQYPNDKERAQIEKDRAFAQRLEQENYLLVNCLKKYFSLS